MSEDLSDLIKNVKNMVNSGNIPDNVKEMLSNLDVSSLSADNINKFSQEFSTKSSANSANLDMDTILKIKSIIDNINTKDDPRANLLYSLKPYLRDSKKNKLDQYVNLLNMTKFVDLMNNAKKENNGNV